MDPLFASAGFYPADILLPQGCDMTRWSVVACDQYTSQPEYWRDVEKIVGDAPSAYKLMLPEACLSGDVGGRIEAINAEMRRYLDGGVFRTVRNSFVYVERRLSNGAVRRGLVGAVDLEQYDFHKGAGSLIRATEGTVLERIPPRVRVRKNAPLELPHVMLLIDDPDDAVIGCAAAKKGGFERLYDFDLMKNGGHITGWAAGGGFLREIAQELTGFVLREAFERRYPGMSGPVLAYAVGDGNHSLATAKECWEQLKLTLNDNEKQSHPARYALVELVNIHDASLVFEPIHRVVFGVDPQKMSAAFRAFFGDACTESGAGHRIGLVAAGRTTPVLLDREGLATGLVQAFIDGYIAKNGGRVDYIHGGDVVQSLCGGGDALGFLLPAMGKSELFRAVIRDGALPRKTFSMGEAQDKRFYLEGRVIR